MQSPATPPDRFAALAAAERFRQAMVHGGPPVSAEELRAQTDALKMPAQEQPDQPAVVKLADQGVVRGSSPTSAASVQLRMTHIPLGMIDQFDEATRPLVTVSVPGGRHRLRVSAGVEGFSTAAIGILESDAGNKDPKSLHLLPTFAQAHAARLSRPVRAAVRVTVENLEGQPRLVDERTLRAWLLPPSTAVLYEKDPSSGVWTSLTDYLAGWVTPDDPAVMSVLRKAAEQTQRRGFVGYQTDENGVLEQVRALYTTLKNLGLLYVNSVAAAGAADAFVQRVRSPAESLRDLGANCIDGAVLYASLLEAASLRAGIVLVPGHAYVAWCARDSNDSWRFLETTMTGTRSFEEAFEQGRANHRTFFAGAAPPATAVAGISGTALLDITELRTRGILPTV